MTDDIATYLKQHTEALVKDVGISAACAITGKSKATIGRYYSAHEEHADRFMPVDAVALLESQASYPHVTVALAELKGLTLDGAEAAVPSSTAGAVSHDIAVLSQRFASLMSAYVSAVEDGEITPTEAHILLQDALELQKVLVDMKMHLRSKVRRA